MMKTLYFMAALALLSSNELAWQQQTIDTNADFRGLSAVSGSVAWVSGTKGTYARTADGGTTWKVGRVPDASKLDFRDVQAFSDRTAYLLSAGPGEQSRIYKTSDGGKTWRLQFKNTDPDGFYDAIAFWDEKNGMALGDPVRGRFQLIATDDGGGHWRPLQTFDLPPTLQNEGAFAASGTCLVTHGDSEVWFGTGGAKQARIFHSRDRGRQWTVHETPLAEGIPSAGIFSIAFRDSNHGIIVGGDYAKPKDVGANVAVTSDGGATWKLVDKALPYRSCVAWAKDRWIAVGTSGSDYSMDDGLTWKPLDRANYNVVAFSVEGHGWAAGPKGRITKWAGSNKE
jgi:photosystem II stability/assembly factor-like uncharacterized protein